MHFRTVHIYNTAHCLVHACINTYYFFCRCVFASNFPIDRLHVTFGQLMNTLNVVLQSYSEEEKQKFFASNAKLFYRL